MKHLDLFSGIGGFALAASRVWPNHEIVGFCEKDKYCQKVLAKNFPGVPIHEDIYELKGQPADLITGGFPCQPFSTAGKQRGKNDDRYLWPEMLRVIRESQPTWVVGENVAGIVGMALDQVLIDLEVEGYACQCFIIPACGVDAPHRRDRIWIVAHARHAESQGWGKATERQQCSRRRQTRGKSTSCCQDVANATELHSNGSNSEPRRKVSESGDCGGQDRREWPAEPSVGRVAHGIPKRVDRLRALGNAIVPACVQPIFEAIKLCPTQTQ